MCFIEEIVAFVAFMVPLSWCKPWTPPVVGVSPECHPPGLLNRGFNMFQHVSFQSPSDPWSQNNLDTLIQQGYDTVMIWCKLILTHCDAVMTHCGPVVYQSLPNHCRAKWRARWLLGGRWNLTSPSEGREARFKWFTFELLKLWAKLQR